MLMRIPIISDLISPKPVKSLKESYIKSLKESGYGLVSTSQTQIFQSSDTKKKIDEDPRKPFLKYITAYLAVPLVSAAIDRTVDFVVSPGYYIDSDSKRAKKQIEEFTQKINFDIFLRNTVKDMLLFGDSFVEIVGKGKRIDELKVLNPVFMRIQRDITGEIKGYYQDLPKAIKNKNNPWKPEQIAHFIHNQVGDSPYGTSIIESLETILDIKVEMEKSLKTIIKRVAVAPYHVKIGNTEKGYPATQADIDAFTNDLQSLTNETNWVTGDLCEIDSIGGRSKVIDIQPFTDHIDNQLVYGLQVPFVLLGKAQIPEGLASVQLEAMDRRAKSIQVSVSKQVEDKVFSRQIESSGMGKKVYLKWGQPSQVTENSQLSLYLEMIKTNLSPEFKQKLENEIAKILGIEHEAPLQDNMNVQGPYQDYVRKSQKGIMGNPDRRKEINLPKKSEANGKPK